MAPKYFDTGSISYFQEDSTNKDVDEDKLPEVKIRSGSYGKIKMEVEEVKYELKD